MDNQEFIPVTLICQHYNVEVAFIDILYDFNLIEFTNLETERCIPAHQLSEFEKIIRLHNELHINAEGLDAVLHLLEKIATMQKEISLLKGKLSVYE